MGRRYSKAFSEWIHQHGFERIPGSTRSVAIDLAEHVTEIEAWRATLTEKQRRQRIHPLSNVSAWKKTTKQPKADDSDDVAKAAAPWRRFVASMGALPLDQAQPLWQAVRAHAARVIG
jgi:hypothetical protein